MNSCLESACEKRVRLHQELKTLANSVAASCLLVFVGHVAMWRCVVDMWRYGINGDLCTAAIVVSSVTAVKHWQRDTPMSEGRAFVAQAETTQLCWNPFWKGATSANCSAKIPEVVVQLLEIGGSWQSWHLTFNASKLNFSIGILELPRWRMVRMKIKNDSKTYVEMLTFHMMLSWCWCMGGSKESEVLLLLHALGEATCFVYLHIVLHFASKQVFADWFCIAEATCLKVQSVLSTAPMPVRFSFQATFDAHWRGELWFGRWR